MPDNIYNKLAKVAAETAAGPVYQGVKALYDYVNSSDKAVKSGSTGGAGNSAPEVKAPTPEKIYNISKPLKEHEVVSEKTVEKFQNDKSLMQNYSGESQADKDNSLLNLENKH